MIFPFSTFDKSQYTGSEQCSRMAKKRWKMSQCQRNILWELVLVFCFIHTSFLLLFPSLKTLKLFLHHQQTKSKKLFLTSCVPLLFLYNHFILYNFLLSSFFSCFIFFSHIILPQTLEIIFNIFCLFMLIMFYLFSMFFFFFF